MTNRYQTPLKYKDGFGKERTGKVYFELDPIELTDWTLENPFEANELRASLIELREIEREDSRDLTPDEIRVMLFVIKLLAELSAGRPTEDGNYFLKDPNWTSSYMYKAFRMLLMTNPKEVQEFLNKLLDNNVMEDFSAALEKANTDLEAEGPTEQARTTDSGESVEAKMEAKIRAKIAEENAAKELAAPSTE